MEELVPQLGFDPEKEKADAAPEDWFFGVDGELTGLADALGLVGCALFAWPQPVNGIYQRVVETFNHAVMLIEKHFDFLPQGEVQRGREDFLDCATRSPVNNYETQFSYAVKNKLLSPENIKWLKDKGYSDADGNVTFSDRFVAIGSGTTRQGNSLKAPNEYIRLNGLIPKSMLPKVDTMTWDQYHDKSKITKEMLALGKEFLKRFALNYEKVLLPDFPKILKNNLYEVFDNYIDKVDGDYIKRLAPDYDMMGYGYRNTINELKKNDMQIAIEVEKRKGTPDYLIKDKQGVYHRIGDEKTFNVLVGSFDQSIEEVEIATDEIGSPIYLGGSFLSVLTNFFSNLKGKK